MRILFVFAAHLLNAAPVFAELTPEDIRIIRETENREPTLQYKRIAALKYYVTLVVSAFARCTV